MKSFKVKIYFHREKDENREDFYNKAKRLKFPEETLEKFLYVGYECWVMAELFEDGTIKILGELEGL